MRRGGTGCRAARLRELLRSLRDLLDLLPGEPLGSDHGDRGSARPHGDDLTCVPAGGSPCLSHPDGALLRRLGWSLAVGPRRRSETGCGKQPGPARDSTRDRRRRHRLSTRRADLEEHCLARGQSLRGRGGQTVGQQRDSPAASGRGCLGFLPADRPGADPPHRRQRGDGVLEDEYGDGRRGASLRGGRPSRGAPTRERLPSLFLSRGDHHGFSLKRATRAGERTRRSG